MSDLIRREPFRELMTLQNLFDRMWNDSLTSQSSVQDIYECYAPLDVYETEDDVIVEAVMPGVKSEDIQISVTGDTLRIKGEMEVNKAQVPKPVKYLLQERQHGAYSRSLRLPVQVDANGASAEVENGILKLSIPKAEAIKPKTISIKSK